MGRRITLTESELIELVQKIIIEQTMTDLDDYELVLLLKQGDQRAQTEFFNRYYKRMKGYVRSKSQKFDSDDIDAIVLRGLQRAITYIDSFKGESNLESWVVRIVRNAMLDVAKQKESNKFKSTKYVDPTVISQVDRYQEGPTTNDVKKIFEKFLDTLNEKERKIMILRSQGASNQEIADNADSTEGTVKWYVSNLMKRFKKYMEQYNR